MALLELGPIAFGGNEAILSFLMRKKVIAEERKCICGTSMSLNEGQM